MQAYLYRLWRTLTGGHNDSRRNILNIVAWKILSSGNVVGRDTDADEGDFPRIPGICIWNLSRAKWVLRVCFQIYLSWYVCGEREWWKIIDYETGYGRPPSSVEDGATWVHMWAGLRKPWIFSPNHGARVKSFQGPKEWFGSKSVITFYTAMFLSGLNFAGFT